MKFVHLNDVTPVLVIRLFLTDNKYGGLTIDVHILLNISDRVPVLSKMDNKYSLDIFVGHREMYN